MNNIKEEKENEFYDKLANNLNKNSDEKNAFEGWKALLNYFSQYQNRSICIHKKLDCDLIKNTYIYEQKTSFGKFIVDFEHANIHTHDIPSISVSLKDHHNNNILSLWAEIYKTKPFPGEYHIGSLHGRICDYPFENNELYSILNNISSTSLINELFNGVKSAENSTEIKFQEENNVKEYTAPIVEDMPLKLIHNETTEVSAEALLVEEEPTNSTIINKLKDLRNKFSFFNKNNTMKID